MTTRAIQIERDKPIHYKGLKGIIPMVSNVQNKRAPSGFAKQFKKNEKR